MRVLVVFCDMLKPDLLKTFNKSIKKTEMDKWLDKFGGTAFVRSYSPAPNTPRALACVYTGKNSKNNGCCKRLHWPKYYLKKGVFTIFDLFERKKHNILVMIDEDQYKCGELPDKKYKKSKIVHNLNDFIKDLEKHNKNKNLFCFLELNDFHYALDDYRYKPKGINIGQKHLSNALNMVFEKSDYNTFDYIILFSDHGCTLREETPTKPIDYIKDRRSRVVLFLHKKGDNHIKLDRNLRSITDILPTLGDVMKTNIKNLDGVSLFKKSKNRHLILEEQYGFSPSVISPEMSWGIRTDEYMYLEDSKNSELYKVVSDFKYRKIKNPDKKLIKKFQKVIAKKSCSYKNPKKSSKQEVKKLNDAKRRYGKYVIGGCMGGRRYSDGHKRPKNIIIGFGRKVKKRLR